MGGRDASDPPAVGGGSGDRRQDGNRSKGQAETALKTVRHFIATTDLLTSAAIDLLAKRCDELERIVETPKPVK